MISAESSYETLIGKDISRAADLLKEGTLVAIPTETVYGLAANALNTAAVLKIYQTKNRPQFNPLIVHTSSLNEALKWTDSFPEEAIKLAETYWPGPLTLLLPKSNLISDIVTSGSNLVAIRVPSHAMTQELLQGINFPIVAPSANPSGYVSPTNAQHVLEGLYGKIPYILDGGSCRVGLESTIIGWNPEGKAVLHRPGGLDTDQIETILGYSLQRPAINNHHPLSPGQLKSHYAPHAPLFTHEQELTDINQIEGVYLIRFKEFHPSFPLAQQRILSASGSPEEAAQHLFSVLRELDALKPVRIYAEKLPPAGLGIAINDRLERARQIWKHS